MKKLELKTDRFLTGMKVTLDTDKGEVESKYIQGSYYSPHDKWQHTVTVEDGKKIAKFAMCIDLKADGRVHYTGIKAVDKDGESIFHETWQDRGNWEEIELASDEVIIGFHGYIHMGWQIVHLGVLTLSLGGTNK